MLFEAVQEAGYSLTEDVNGDRGNGGGSAYLYPAPSAWRRISGRPWAAVLWRFKLGAVTHPE